MIDLIIPVYNNRVGLRRTLQSINFDVFKVTIIDDCSTETYNLDKFNVNYVKLEKNIGPGNARQYGINITTNPYIMFIDAGDFFMNKEFQLEIKETIINNPEINLFFWRYYSHIINVSTDDDNRLHGKAYKRSFLKQYNIEFCPNSSYVNEDVGFNRLCRLISAATDQSILFLTEPIIRWVKDKNSLTQTNHQELLYKKQTRGLSLNAIHTIETYRKHQLNEEIITNEIYEIASALYYWFIRTASDRPEFIQDAWNGAKIFFDKFKDELKPNQLVSGNAYLMNAIKYKTKINFPINLLRFADDIEKNQIIPARYLT